MDSFKKIQSVYIEYREGRISLDEFEKKLSKICTKKELVDFLGNVISQGWITPFNMGTD